MKILNLFFLVFFLFSVPAFSQISTDSLHMQKDKLYRISMNDGSVYMGKIIAIEQGKLKLKTETLGKLELVFSEVVEMKVASDLEAVNENGWFENPNPVQYFFTPSGFGIKKGEWYFQNTELILNSFHYGLTDHFSIGAGFEIFSLSAGQPLVYINPKMYFELAEKFHVALAGVVVSSITYDDIGGLGTISISGTYGTKDRNISLAGGLAFTFESTTTSPVVSLSGIYRFSRRLAFISENTYLIEPNKFVFSYGLRFFSKKFTVGLGLISQPELMEDTALKLGIPYIDFMFKF